MTTRREFLAAGAAIAAAPGSMVQAQPRRLTIGSNPAGTDYYVVGGGMAKLLTEKLNMQAIVQPYAGSSVYLPMIQAGEVTMGLSSTLDAGGAFRGEQGRTPMTKLRSLMRLWPLAYALMVKKDSPVQRVADLKGKRVVMDFKANVALAQINQAVVASAGLAQTDITPVSVAGIPQGVRGVVEGNIEGTWVAVGIPAVREAHASVGIRYVDMTGPNFTEEFLSRRVAGLFPLTLNPAPNLPELPAAVQVIGFDVFIVGSADMPADQVKTVLGTLYESFEALQTDYPAMRRGAKNQAARASNAVPYHPAAADFYKSKQLWTAQNDAKDATLAKP